MAVVVGEDEFPPQAPSTNDAPANPPPSNCRRLTLIEIPILRRRSTLPWPTIGGDSGPGAGTAIPPVAEPAHIWSVAEGQGPDGLPAAPRMSSMSERATGSRTEASEIWPSSVISASVTGM